LKNEAPLILPLLLGFRFDFCWEKIAIDFNPHLPAYENLLGGCGYAKQQMQGPNYLFRQSDNKAGREIYSMEWLENFQTLLQIRRAYSELILSPIAQI
jgi:hypothetical protein